MAYGVEYVGDADYVSATMIGEMTTNELEACRAEIASVMEMQDCRRLLVDATKESPRRDILDDFEFTSEHNAHFPPGTRHAIVINTDEKDYMQFIENVAQNRGVDLNIFIDRDQALAWLLRRRPADDAGRQR